ncbi:MAG: DUF1801 domain-containing protein [Ignavibacteriae bacterium]|nr:DUF1801 domain-containing protein [Ignavibacteriota bacterium]NOG99403.1 DUF1801 domain-containing protein [Ignavibacteriota bacterium]
MKLIENPEVEKVFDKYPEKVQRKLIRLRKIILETAEGIDGLNDLEETLKWGEPSYLTKKGSTIRIDWKKSKPDQYAIYFKCTSKLIETFKIIYGDVFTYEGNRAIVFKMKDKIPLAALKHCISLALNYHKIKHMPLLGATKK